MDHAEARGWLDDAFFQPGRLAQLDDPVLATTDPADPELASVRQHLETCAECAVYAESVRRTALTLEYALGPTEQSKARVLAAVKSVGRHRESVSGQPVVHGRERGSVGIVGPWWRQILSPRMAAALVVVALVGGIVGGVWGLSAQKSTAPDQRFIAAVGMMAELAGDPQSKSVALRDAAGQNTGAALISTGSGRIAVFASSLGPGSADEWSCYLERNGRITELGPMHFSAGVSYWAGWLTALPDAGQPGDQLTIAMNEGSEPVLVGTF